MDAAERIRIFGTDEEASEQRVLRAGPLTAILEEGNLRYIRFNGVEVVRSINYLARDSAWGTYRAVFSNFRVEEGENWFLVAYHAECGDGNQQLSYEMQIEGRSSGKLILEASALADTDFQTNRTGFVILHPAELAGRALTVRHTDGSVEETAFPKQIMADQPAFDIAELTYHPLPSLSCTVRMEGDAFEMEDQRNWTDASFKTYVRPLSRPRPYTIARGMTDRQRVEITVEGATSDTVIGRRPSTSPIFVGKRMPTIALFADETVPAFGYDLHPSICNSIILRLDPTNDSSAFAFAAAQTQKARIKPCVEIVFAAQDPDLEAREALAYIAEAGMTPTALLATCRRDFKTRPSSTLPDGEATMAQIIAALRRCGFRGPIGSGTPSNFTEFNRNPPPPECDFIYFSVSAIVHAADDTSVVETLNVYPDIIASARALCPGKPIWLGPCTIGPRHNPYGLSVLENPKNVRTPAAQHDPRQAALFGAAFAVGIVSEASKAGVDVLTLAAPHGPFGLTGPNGSSRPLSAVHGVVADAAGADIVGSFFLEPQLKGVAWHHQGCVKVLASNLSPENRVIEARLRNAKLLTANGWVECSEHGSINLPPYGTILAHSMADAQE